MGLGAVIFDLDGVITDTAEYHFQAWKRLAQEEGIPFTREDNEQLRGVSRRASLLLILRGRSVSEETLQEMMARKNGYYRELLAQISEEDLLPGVRQLLHELDGAGVPYAIASASRNARDVVRRLGLEARLVLVADGNSVRRAKPAPDLFRFAAAGLQVPPARCLVVEDAAAGVEAALAAGMPALALGPAERFEELEPESGRFTRWHNLEGVSLDDLRAVVAPDPTWVVVQEQFQHETQHHMETVFTTGNGYFATRGSLEEGYPGDKALTLAHGIFDDAPIVVTELVNLPNWLDARLHVDGQLFRMDEGQVLFFHRQLDLRRAVLQRHVRWQAPNGVIVDLTFERFISYTRQHVAALRLLVTPVNEACDVTVASGIEGHVANDDLLHWRHLDQGYDGARIWLHSRTRHSRVELATAAVVSVAGEGTAAAQRCPDYPSLQVARRLAPGQTLHLEKLASYTSSRDRAPNGAGVVGRALAHLEALTYEALKLEHLAAWRDVWRDIDVLVEGDEAAQLALRFNLFQLQVAAPRHDDRVSIGAKTLSGLGYRGHVFWDTEIFILPFFIYTQPEIARNLLMYRYHTLPGARRKAQANGYRGAQYAWESALSGDEVTPAWVPDMRGKGLVRIWTGDIEIHISADVAYAVMQYWRVTGDDDFMRDYGAEIVLDTARFWADRAEPEEVDGQRRYSYRDVIGPDEYHEHVDNNVYTNRMAQWHLETAREVWEWLQANAPEKARALGQALELTEEELARWRDVAQHIVILHDEETGLMTQFEGFFDLEPVDWERYEDRRHSMQYLLGIKGANRSQVIKQADVIMLLALLREEYDDRTWRANWDAYMPLTDHQYGSSLGPSFHAWAACEMGRPDEAYDYFMLAARADLHDVRGNAGDGIHAASAGGVWQAAVFGFAGLQLTGDGHAVTPRLPAHWRRLRFKFYRHGEEHVIDLRQEKEVE
ncbi:MAG TPA: beta-phosphoglucomutase [Candidatus Sulfomarinibacteraceae bacterium]|nr:beta-phosphoglucomutase [Candidatus Sulfomarinibacteraceae bacterium]